MSYMALGGGDGPSTGAGISALAATGLSTGMINNIWAVAAVFIIVGTALIVSKFYPHRLALDPVVMPSGKNRPWFTVNGRPVGRRFRTHRKQ